tara:strand:- start:1685 stop:1927 length:243 start_codon:yes stop_codon:yes gene_type:complete
MRTFLTGLLLLSLCSCQSGCFSRFGGSAAELKLPEDFHAPIGFARTDLGKHLFYHTTSGDMKVIEYSDWGVLEAEYIFVK